MSVPTATTNPDELRLTLPTFPQPGRLLPGDRIEVQNRFDGGWARGFEVVDVLTGMGTRRYRIKRVSDGVVLPRLFVEDEIDTAR
jgi:hypothetical protein